MDKNDTSLHFRDIELNDKPNIDALLKRYPTQKLNYCFEVLYLWREACEYQINITADQLLIKTFINCHHNFLYPLGEDKHLSETIEKMIEYAEARRCPFRIFQISEDQKTQLETLFPGRFEFIRSRDEEEYIYTTEKLITLSGKRLQHKRNHINYFEQHYTWSFEPINQTNLPECHAFNRQWFEHQRQINDCGEMLEMELLAIEKAFNEWSILNLDGAMLRANGDIVAYAVGAPLSKDTYLTLFEKSRHDIRGASQQINKLFTEYYARQYKYINRAEDGGDEGLRQAKLSYYPDILAPLYIAKLKNENP